MTTGKEDIRRWRQTSSDPRALTARAADLADAVRAVPPLSPETLARIKVEVLSQRPSRTGRGLPLGLRFATLMVVVLASVATAKGTMILWRRHIAASATPPAPTRPSAPTSVRSRPRAVAAAPEESPAVVPPEVVLAPAPLEVPMVPATTSHAHPRRTAMVGSHAPSRSHVADDPAPLATEAQLLARALSRLRQAHDPAGALALLDQHARAFPHGVLESEALSARLEAVIEMDDRTSALRLLDGRSAFAGRLGRQQLLTRAELRTSAGRNEEGLADFERLLTAPGVTAAPGELERALYGRAVCLGHLGQDERARADLIDYERRFPQGKYVAEVARLLKGTGPEHRQ
ncbi:MAG TPA: hypothetical protein VFH73_07975 [Polyangia bacterium]|jgi:hypothetical protein|nr:hypothetical protein [Polyangia bacterium]